MTNVINAYAPFFKGWLKQYGGKPTETELTLAGRFGRQGKQTLALAMALRAEGVTASQIVGVCGAPQNNHRREVIEAGWFKRDMTVPAHEGTGHTVYKITLTPKGEREAAKRAAGEAAKAEAGEVKASKAKGKAKAKVKATGKRKPPVTDNAADVTDRVIEGGPVDPQMPAGAVAGDGGTDTQPQA